MSNLAKLRFALISEDALEKLRPRPQSELAPPPAHQMGEIYTAITTTVNEMLEQKLQSLNLNKLIEDKIMELQARQNAGTFYQNGGQPVDYHQPVVYDRCGDSLLAARESLSAHSVRSRGLRRLKKRRAKSGAGTITVLGDKPKSKLRKILSQKVAKPPSQLAPVSTKPLPKRASSTTTTTTSTTTAKTGALVARAAQPRLTSHQVTGAAATAVVGGRGGGGGGIALTTESEAEEPSILTLAAKYLQELDESRRKTRRQSPDRF